MTIIKKVGVLHGHTDFDSGFEVGGYPYGRLTCKIRYWVETKPKFGQRFVSRTENPKTGRWNNPKADTYADMVVLTSVPQDGGDLDHIRHWSFHRTHITPVGYCRSMLAGVYDGLTDEQRATFDRWVSATRNSYSGPWIEFDKAIDLIAAHLRDTGTDPVLDNGLWMTPDGQRCYLGSHGDPDVYFAVARERLADETD